MTAALVSSQDSKNFVARAATTYGRNMDDTQAFVAIAILCQKGGTSRKAKGSVYAIVNGHRIDLSFLRKVMTRFYFHNKTMGKNTGK